MSGLPRLHAVTDDGILARDGWVAEAAAVAEACGPLVALHVRGPRTDGAMLFRSARGLVTAARTTGARVLVNDRVDVALAADADGVHLGRRSLAVHDARRLLGAGRAVGRSCHGPADIGEALDEGADYAFVGTIFPTPSHPGLPGIGVTGLREALGRAATMPVLAIGGIEPEGVGGLIEAGAYGVAVVRGVWDRPDPAGAARQILEAIEEANDG